MAPFNAVNEQKPRQIAAMVLDRRRIPPAGGVDALQNVYTETLLGKALEESKLAPVDRRLCQELVYGVVRWQATLDWLIARKTNGRTPSSTLQNLLRLGLYQIFLLDRIPDYAVVNETVNLAKQSGSGQRAGFVNALLRGYLREADATRKLLADLKLTNPAIGWSHPEWLLARWQKRWNAATPNAVTTLLEWNNSPPKTFARINTLKFLTQAAHTGPLPRRGEGVVSPDEDYKTKIANAGDLLTRWRAENVEYDFVRRDWLEENLVFELKSHPPLRQLQSFKDGYFYIQDPSTLLAPRCLEPQQGEAILDLCAAPGGKTTYMAQLLEDQGRIIASDVSEQRLQLLRENCARLDATCVKIHNSPPSNLKFDRILVDAPCSNTGVLRRRVDLRWWIRPEEISRLQQTQLDLLNLASTKLKPGGVLVYSTCSLEPEENQCVVNEFLASHRNFKLDFERELLPFADKVDGAYLARLGEGGHERQGRHAAPTGRCSAESLPGEERVNAPE
jgi:16S rRNA (cytosine967-C5)-methyltransferase